MQFSDFVAEQQKGMPAAKCAVIDSPPEVIDYGKVFGESENQAAQGVDCLDTVLDK